MKKIILLSIMFSALLVAHASYTAYSGAPTGSKGTCASSCHGSGTGTITVTGIPAMYVPLTTYTITVKHNGGSTISNFNASSRKGATSTTAGTFTASTNSALYSVSGYESGVRGSSNNIDEAVFKWTAPSAGSGEVKIYLSGLQGSKSGATTKIILNVSESVTGVSGTKEGIESFELNQNYPNPFNPVTVINYQLAVNSHVSLKVFDVLGNEVATLVNEKKDAGNYSVKFDGIKLSTGIYFACLQRGDRMQIKKMSLIK
jgi:hypothetical protein